MGIPDSSLSNLIEKIRYWISWREKDQTPSSEMSNNRCDCGVNFTKSCPKYYCETCDRVSCMNCVQSYDSFADLKSSIEPIMNIKSCLYCSGLSIRHKGAKKYCEKIYPSDSPRQSPEPPSPNMLTKSTITSFSSLPSSLIRSDEDDEEEDSTSQYYHDNSDLESTSVSVSVSVSDRQEIYSETTTSPLDSPVQRGSHTIAEEKVSLDFENNGLIWLPPSPDFEQDDSENSFFTYEEDDDEDETDEINEFSRHNVNIDQKEPLRATLHGHFTALVSQLLQGEGIIVNKEDWLSIITSLAWRAANYVKPDTSKGGSMDPCNYVKVKCLASGKPNESSLIKGVVCTKNIKHKRMISQYKNARLLLLGGALEYQRLPNQLSSLDTVLQQETDHMKMIVSKIEAHHPNVLLVEKSVCSRAQEYLLAKEISLVLNVKRPLLERIARCTSSVITPSIDHLSSTRVGHCELFRVDKVSEEHEVITKKPSKTLMFFEGCPKRLGCTVLLKGSSREELKKVKHVIQYAIFAAYHLSLETSFLADEGASLPNKHLKTSIAIPEKINSVSDHNAISLIPEKYDDDSLSCENLLLLDENETPNNNVTELDSHQNILVSFSSRCIISGSVCERSRLLRIQFYGSFDKPLGRYLKDDLFDQSSSCVTCKEPTEGHVICYTHQQGNLTINVKRLINPKLKLPGEKDGKIWMWHRCLKCNRLSNGVPPVTNRVIMSDPAWGLSFGKFLELSFSNHATANRIASCGHSLQRDCLRFYGFGSMVAFFRYSPIDILSVCLPPSILEFNGVSGLEYIRKEADELLRKVETMYTEMSNILENIEQKFLGFGNVISDTNELYNHVMDLKDLLFTERNDLNDMLQQGSATIDILELNRVRHSVLINSHIWDRRLYSLDSLVEKTANFISFDEVKESSNDSCYDSLEQVHEDIFHEGSKSVICTDDTYNHNTVDDVKVTSSLERAPSEASVLSEKIDLAWTGAEQLNIENPIINRVISPARVFSFDSAVRLQERIKKSHLSNIRSFHASGDYKSMVKDPVSAIMHRTYSQTLPNEAQKRNLSSFISSISILPQGARLMVPQSGKDEVIIAVYENEPTSIISYALSTKDYEERIIDKPNNILDGGVYNGSPLAANISAWQSFGSVDLDYITYSSNYGSEDSSNNSPHLRISFEDESLKDKVKFFVTCYFAKEFDALRTRCCANGNDFLRSLSRCKRWSAQGGKSNVYFAKSFDDRFIIKQVTKTELESFQEFAPSYFKYMTESLSSGSPTCLAKILGIYQVKNLKSGKESKLDLMVMENLFYKRRISKIYDLKGSVRSRYNSDTNGTLLDMNLLETLCTKPIFLGSKAKRSLERAVWNDTSFLASIDVMDYSLLVGVDDEGKELVLGIIDFMRQYTWDKHLETWVKASGILGGPKNVAPTIISPKQYKKRFRKAMTTYFLTVPDQWLS